MPSRKAEGICATACELRNACHGDVAKSRRRRHGQRDLSPTTRLMSVAQNVSEQASTYRTRALDAKHGRPGAAIGQCAISRRDRNARQGGGRPVFAARMPCIAAQMRRRDGQFAGARESCQSISYTFRHRGTAFSSWTAVGDTFPRRRARHAIAHARPRRRWLGRRAAGRHGGCCAICDVHLRVAGGVEIVDGDASAPRTR